MNIKDKELVHSWFSLILLLIAPFIGGVIIWFSYPHIHAVFPLAIDSGVLAKELGLWDSCCIAWLATVLFGKNVNAKIRND